MEPGYYDQDGNRIDVLEWARLYEDTPGRTVAADHLPDERGLVKTVWLGFHDPSLASARLFGTALLLAGEITELEQYDSKQEALDGHRRHVAALTERDGD